MKILNEQAQLFLVAAVCFAVGLGILYLALGIYGMLVDKALRWFAVHAALTEYMLDRRNRKRWWRRLVDWWDSRIHRE